jgi:hypothetical protein
MLVLLLGLFGIQAGAADYEQLPGNFGGFSSDGSVLTVADDFRFEQDTLVGGVIWWGGYFNPPPGPDNFTVSLFSDSGGHPGSVLAQFPFGAVPARATGRFVNAPDFYPEFQYSASFPTSFLAQAGVKYWISIVNPPRDIWLWEASGSTLNPGVQRRFNGDFWQPYLDNTAFRLVSGSVSGSPVITEEPVDRSAVVGNPATFSVQAVGAPTLAYQWYRDGTLINRATNALHTIPHVAISDNAGYSVVVANSSGSVTSRVAQLTVRFLEIDCYPGVKILGAPGRTYRIEATPATGAPNWQTLTNLVLPSSPYIWIDYESPTLSQRFYRVAELPE